MITQECGETNAKEKEGSEVTIKYNEEDENDVQKGRPNTHLNEMGKANADMRDAYQNPSPSRCSFLGIIVFTVHNRPKPFHSVIGEGRPKWAGMGLTLPFFPEARLRPPSTVVGGRHFRLQCDDLRVYNFKHHY